jgi:hypothetical protein
MTPLHISTWVAIRWHDLRHRLTGDRGDSPVSTAIIVAIIAAAAFAVATAVALAATNWTAEIPQVGEE